MKPAQMLRTCFWLLLALVGGHRVVAQAPGGTTPAPAQLHLNSILGSSPEDSLFLRMMMEKGLAQSPDLMFVTHRELLRPLCVSVCSRDSVIIHDTLSDGTDFRLALYASTFEPDSHRYAYFEGPDSLIESIDERPAYGAVDHLPTKQLDSLDLRIDGRSLMVPRSAYRCFYDVNLCQLEYFLQPVMAYPSLDEQYFYLYLYGGEGASTYFTKLVFDRERYLTRLVAEYAILSRSQSLRPDFVGF